MRVQVAELAGADQYVRQHELEKLAKLREQVRSPPPSLWCGYGLTRLRLQLAKAKEELVRFLFLAFRPGIS